ncbi:SDR family NAD(P)-dependent oxidoreductase [Echinicola strongylocentroti]|uniref:SDR family NAD(P)-dependent oxidoreductase n=1 Tax=Echinicola strongylocentroti TaxID=1795355 RepID=A0A2Z4IFE8_9BACT|nr:SDR family oxidoreductase [Echinicola strongylocentroti]AWW29218.1 SDR family NAD(P)-dependent oxidoreductase [Echinicola strongylocentroti]
MKVLVIGANGQIGQLIVDSLQAAGDFSPIAMVRKEEQVAAFKEKGLDSVLADLEGPVEGLASAMEGVDAVVFTAGSGGKTGDDKTLLIDLDGAVKCIEAAEKTGVKRFVMISALQANNRENWNDSLRPYYVAKHYADRMLEMSSLDYTIIRPGGLLNEPGNGKVSAGGKLDRSTIPRADVAETVLEVLKTGHTINKSFDLVSGDDSIADALGKI